MWPHLEEHSQRLCIHDLLRWFIDAKPAYKNSRISSLWTQNRNGSMPFPCDYLEKYTRARFDKCRRRSQNGQANDCHLSRSRPRKTLHLSLFLGLWSFALPCIWRANLTITILYTAFGTLLGVRIFLWRDKLSDEKSFRIYNVSTRVTAPRDSVRWLIRNTPLFRCGSRWQTCYPSSPFDWRKLLTHNTYSKLSRKRSCTNYMNVR